MAHRRPDRDRTDPTREVKSCASCGRDIVWRKKWASTWDDVTYCSGSCRARGLGPTDHELERTILALLASRAETASICPSDAARAIGGEEWRDLMEPARRAARRLVAAGQVDITQKGVVVDPSTAKGPIRIRRHRN